MNCGGLKIRFVLMITVSKNCVLCFFCTSLDSNMLLCSAILSSPCCTVLCCAVLLCFSFSKEKKLRLEAEKIHETVHTYDSICKEKFTQAKNILHLHKNYESLKQKNTRGRVECIKKCQRALQLAIERATEQQSHGSERLSKDADMLAQLQARETAAAKAELLSISALLSQAKSSQHLSSASLGLPTNAREEEEESPSENYEAMWQSSRVQFPALTGSIRSAVLSDEKHRHAYSFKKKKKLLAPKGASASMTNHI
jgi:hypothetical protein